MTEIKRIRKRLADHDAQGIYHYWMSDIRVLFSALAEKEAEIERLVKERDTAESWLEVKDAIIAEKEKRVRELEKWNAEFEDEKEALKARLAPVVECYEYHSNGTIYPVFKKHLQKSHIVEALWQAICKAAQEGE